MLFAKYVPLLAENSLFFGDFVLSFFCVQILNHRGVFLIMFFRKYFCIALCTLLLLPQTLLAQVQINEISSPTKAKLNRERGLNMLDEIKSLIKENYYDKNFRGINLDERFKIAKEKVKTLDTNRQIFRVIAQVVLEFNDSHTRFYPPNRVHRVEYGFTMQMIGQNCFITDVKKDSDAEAKGLKPGDLVVGIGDYAPTRENLWKMNYVFYALDPQESIKLYVISPNEKK
jgi:C-terminal processing protease CtpA/Prc